MKTLISTIFGTLLSLSLVTTVSAQVYYSYDGGYAPYSQNIYNQQLTPRYPGYYSETYPASYTYTQGCYTYYYDGRTNTTSVKSYICTTPSQYQTYTQTVTPTVSYYYVQQPEVYSYSVPSTSYVTPYSTYQYQNNAWYTTPYNNYSSYYGNQNTYNNNYNYTCVTINGMQACY